MKDALDCTITVPSLKILRLIETVDPNDTKGLDDINRAVQMYLLPKAKRRMIEKGAAGLYGVPSYTNSRDALKNIRPEGWYFRIDYVGTLDGQKPIVEARKDDVVETFQSGKQKTEELAELHAILQTIEFERKIIAGS